MNFKYIVNYSHKTATKQWNMEVSNLFFSKPSINQCLKVYVILVFMLQSELVKYLKVTLCLGLQFVFAVTLFAREFCLWSCWCGGWRSVKPIKFWQHDKRFNNRKLNTYLHFFVILIDMYCLKKLLYDYQYIICRYKRCKAERKVFILKVGNFLSHKL